MTVALAPCSGPPAAVKLPVWVIGHAERGRPLVIAHRGGAALAPENSLAAFAAARAAGADAIETDLRLTADGVAVCAHDDAIAGADGARIMIAHASLAALRRAAPSIAIFNDAASPGFAAYLDIKETAPQRVVALLGTLAVERCGADWIVGVASTALADTLAQHFPALRQVGLMLDRREIAAFARARPGQWVRVHEPRATAALIAELRDAGLRVMITCGGGARPTGAIDAAGVARLVALAPDGVILDDPRLAGARS